VLKKPRFEVSKLLELHGDAGKVSNTSEDLGASVDRPDNYEPPVQEAV
jgi:small subunit ribosomal protein S3Ae